MPLAERAEMGKRILKSIVILLAAMVVIIIGYNLFGGALCNNVRAAQIEKSFSSLELPEGTELIETASFVGNTSGTGNHTEIWAGMLVYSKLAEEDLNRYFEGYDVYGILDSQKNDWPRAMRNAGFSRLDEAMINEGYFVIGSYYEAFTQADIRGH